MLALDCGQNRPSRHALHQSLKIATKGYLISPGRAGALFYVNDTKVVDLNRTPLLDIVIQKRRLYILYLRINNIF